MTLAIPFAGLAPDARSVRGRGELSSLDMAAAIDMGRDLQRSCAGDVSTRDVAAALVDAVNAFEHEGRAACALVQAFVTRRQGGGTLETPNDPDPLCLRLVATRGIEPEWNDEELSSNHRAMALEGSAAALVTEIACQLHVDDPFGPAVNTFYIADAATSPAVLPKKWVKAYGIGSLFGFGARVWPGEGFVVLAFARAFVERSTVRLFETVAAYAKLSWMSTREGRAAIGAEGYDHVHASALEELVAMHESHLREAVVDFRLRLESMRAAAQRAADVAAENAEVHNRGLRRTQRAMLNVIEDLREARGALATRVDERTRELALANEQLASRNRALEEFAYIASHDLQEPLRTVSGYLQMIQRRYGSTLNAEADEFIRFAIEGAQRMQALIESLLLYSRVTAAEAALEPTSLDEVLDIVLQNLALHIEETQATIERAPLPTLAVDRMQMIQLFQNLLSNALKFAGPKPPRVRVGSRLASGVWTITVRDEGIGFDPKFADRIFKVFRRLRRDTPGTGIGLAVCKKIVERHGGRIEADSAPGAGSTFSVHFPEGPSSR